MTVAIIESRDLTPCDPIYGLEITQFRRIASTRINSTLLNADNGNVEIDFTGGAGNYTSLKLNSFRGTTGIFYGDFLTNSVNIKKLTIQNQDCTTLYVDLDGLYKTLYSEDSIEYADYEATGPICLLPGQSVLLFWTGNRRLVLWVPPAETDTFFTVTAEW